MGEELAVEIMKEVKRYDDGNGCTRRQLVDNILILISQSSRASVAAPQGDAEHERPPVVHLGNMPIEEEDRHTRAELERRFEISERLRNDPFVAEEWTDEFPQVEEALYWVRHKQNHTDLDVARLRNGSLYPTDGGAMSKSRRRDWEYLGPINRFTTPVAPSPTPEQTCKCGLPKDDPIHSYTTEWQQMHTFIPKSAPPSTQPSARVAAEEIQDWNQYGEGKGSYEADVAYIESIITKHCFPSGQPVEEAPDPCAVAGFHVCGPKDGELRKHVESYIGSTDAVREDS